MSVPTNPRLGWICPKCQRGNSPDVLTCQCNQWFTTYSPVIDTPETNLPDPYDKPMC